MPARGGRAPSHTPNPPCSLPIAVGYGQVDGYPWTCPPQTAAHGMAKGGFPSIWKTSSLQESEDMAKPVSALFLSPGGSQANTQTWGAKHACSFSRTDIAHVTELRQDNSSRDHLLERRRAGTLVLCPSGIRRDSLAAEWQQCVETYQGINGS